MNSAEASGGGPCDCRSTSVDRSSNRAARRARNAAWYELDPNLNRCLTYDNNQQMFEWLIDCCSLWMRAARGCCRRPSIERRQFHEFDTNLKMKFSEVPISGSFYTSPIFNVYGKTALQCVVRDDLTEPGHLDNWLLNVWRCGIRAAQHITLAIVWSEFGSTKQTLSLQL